MDAICSRDELTMNDGVYPAPWPALDRATAPWRRKSASPRSVKRGDVGRLVIVEELRRGDSSPSRLGKVLGMGSNLLEDHLQVLEQAD
jgi:hypothetical protein